MIIAQMSVTESEWAWEILSDEQLEFCRKVSLRRQQNAEANDRPPKNNAPTDAETSILFNALGALGEGALVCYLKREFKQVKWHYFKEGSIKNLPDIEDWIDAKAARCNTHSLIVQPDDPPGWAYVLAYCERSPRIALVGWCWGDEAQAVPMTDPAGGRPAHFIKPSAVCMKSMPLLIEEMRQRRGAYIDNAGHLQHYCACGEWGAFGRGVDLRAGKLGSWTCAEHRPSK